MPAQPPLRTPTRKPAIGLPAASVNSRMRAAAASVNVIACLRRSFDAIVVSVDRGQGPAPSSSYSTATLGLTGHVPFRRFGGARLDLCGANVASFRTFFAPARRKRLRKKAGKVRKKCEKSEKKVRKEAPESGVFKGLRGVRAKKKFAVLRLLGLYE